VQKSAVLHVASSDSDENPFDIKLTALALPPPEGLSLAQDPLIYSLEPGNLFVDPTATVRESNSVSWATRTLEVDFQPVGADGDQLAIRNQGNDTNQLGVAATKIVSAVWRSARFWPRSRWIESDLQRHGYNRSGRGGCAPRHLR